MGRASLEIALLEPRPLKEVAREIPNEICAIVSKATAAERGQRYQSAEALLLDVQLFLESKPVSAMAYSSVYRVRKFLRRYFAAVTGAIAVVLILISSVLIWLEAQQFGEESYARAMKIEQGLNIARDRQLARHFDLISQLYLQLGDHEKADAFASRARTVLQRNEADLSDRSLDQADESIPDSSALHSGNPESAHDPGSGP